MSAYKHTDEDGATIEVSADFGGQAIVTAEEKQLPGRASVYVTKEQAPALALAILEGAGVKDIGDGRVSHVVRELRAVLADQAKAAEDAKLDEEAEAYRAAWHGADFSFDCVAFEHLAAPAKETWRAVARKAHELHGKAAS